MVGIVGCHVHCFCVDAAGASSFVVLLTFSEVPSLCLTGSDDFFDVLVGVPRPLCQDAPECLSVGGVFLVFTWYRDVDSICVALVDVSGRA